MGFAYNLISRKIYTGGIVMAFYSYLNGGADTGGPIVCDFKVAFAKIVEIGASAHTDLGALNTTLPSKTLTVKTAAGADGYVWAVGHTG